MSSETVILKVKMSCSGCSGAVNKVLEKMQGVESFDIDLKEQKVTVKGNVKPQDVFDTVSKTGKKTEFWVEPENKPTEIATEVEPQNKSLENSIDPDNKPSENITFDSIEPKNKQSETTNVAS